MKSKNTMLSNNNDSSMGPSNSTHRSGTLMTGTTKMIDKSERMLDQLQN